MSGKLIRIQGDFSQSNLGKVTPIDHPTPTVPVVAVSITNKADIPSPMSGDTGQTFQILYVISPSDASNQGVTFTSSNQGIISVSSTGLLTAVGNGSSTITIRSNADSSITDSVVVSSTKISTIPVSSVIISNKSGLGTLNPVASETFQLSVSVLPLNATDKTVSYESANPAIASVSSTGLITAISTGSTTITVKSNVDNTKMDSVIVTCGATVIPITGVSITNKAMVPAQIDADTGGTFQLISGLIPPSTTQTGVTWTSSNPAIATVNQSGLVTAVSTGTVTITLKSAVNAALTDVVTVNVIQSTVTPITGINITNKIDFASIIHINEGETINRQLLINIVPANTTQKQYTIQSTDSTIVEYIGKVDGTDILKLKSKTGSATITIQSVSNPTIYDTIIIDVVSDVVHNWEMYGGLGLTGAESATTHKVQDPLTTLWWNNSVGADNRGTSELYDKNGVILQGIERMTRAEVATYRGVALIEFANNYETTETAKNTWGYAPNFLCRPYGVGGFNNYLNRYTGFGIKGLPANESMTLRILSSTSRQTSANVGSKCGILQINNVVTAYPDMSFLDNITWITYNVTSDATGKLVLTWENNSLFNNNYENFVINSFYLVPTSGLTP